MKLYSCKAGEEAERERERERERNNYRVFQKSPLKLLLHP